MADEFSKLILADTAVSALEQPSRRRFFRRKRRETPPLTHCENCSAQLTGHYCAQCGQPAIDYRRSFRHVIVDLLNEFLNWDSKFAATIGLLMAKPWRLTNEFLAGKRVRYVHPLRLYLLASILFFFAVNYWARGINVDPSKLNATDRAELEAELKDPDLPPAVRDKLAARLRERSPSPQPSPTAPTASIPPSSVKSPPPSVTEMSPAGIVAGPKDRPFILFDPGTAPKTSTERWFEERAKEKFGEHGTRFGLFIKTLISNLPYMMLACIPLFAFVLKLLYIRRRIFYVDHLVYALHIHTFAYLAGMLIILATIGLNRTASGALAGWIIALLWVAFALQIFLSIRRVYRQGWFFTIFKFFVGGFVYMIVLLVALAATFFVTLVLPTS